MNPSRYPRMLLPGLIGIVLAGQEPSRRPPEKASERITDSPISGQEHDKGEVKHRNAPCGQRRQPSVLWTSVQALWPRKELRDDLNRRTGLGLGLQWIRDHGDHHARRTRLEWNTFPEGRGPAGTRTSAANYLLSWDHLFRLNRSGGPAYLVTGLGGARWGFERSTAEFRETQWTTKLAVTAGAGLRIADRAILEIRYVVSSIDRAFDSSTLQASLGWHF